MPSNTIKSDVTLPSEPTNDAFSGRWQHYVDYWEINQVRRMVRHTGSLVAGGTVREKLGINWACSMGDRLVFWNPFDMDTGKFHDHDTLIFLIAHEAGHLVHSGGYEWHPDLPVTDRPRFHRLVNSVEDIRTERLTQKRLLGFRHYRRHAYNIFHPRFCAKVPGMGAVDQAHAWHMARELDLEYPVLGEWVRDVVRGHWASTERIIATARSTAEVAERVWPLWVDLREITTKQDQGESVSGDSGGIVVILRGERGDASDASDASQYPSGGGEEDGDAWGDADDSEPFAEHDEDDDGEGGVGDGIGTGSGYEVTDTPIRSPHDPHDDNRPGSHDNDYERGAAEAQAQDAVDPEVAEQLREEAAKRDHRGFEIGKVYDRMSKRGDVTRNVWLDYAGQWDAAVAAEHSTANALSHRLRSILSHNAQQSYEGRKKRGRLDSAHAWRAFAGDRKIFRTRNAVGTYDYTFGIVVDVSGSMKRFGGELGCGFEPVEGPKLHEVVCPLIHAIDRAGIKTFVIPHSDNPHGIKEIRHKLADTRGWLMRQFNPPGGGTYEAPSLVLADEQFSISNSPGKVLLTITDGMTDWADESEKLIADMSERGIVCVGIGLAGYVPEQYPTHIDVGDMEGLVRELPAILTSIIRRGA